MSKKKTESKTTDGAPTRRVRFDHPGIRAIGSYRPGVEYDVTPEEAERLVHSKGFRYCDAGDAGQEN